MVAFDGTVTKKHVALTLTLKDLLGEIADRTFPAQSKNVDVLKLQRFFIDSPDGPAFRIPVADHLDELRRSVSSGTPEWRSMKNILLTIAFLKLTRAERAKLRKVLADIAPDELEPEDLSDIPMSIGTVKNFYSYLDSDRFLYNLKAMFLGIKKEYDHRKLNIGRPAPRN